MRQLALSTSDRKADEKYLAYVDFKFKQMSDQLEKQKQIITTLKQSKEYSNIQDNELSFEEKQNIMKTTRVRSRSLMNFDQDIIELTNNGRPSSKRSPISTSVKQDNRTNQSIDLQENFSYQQFRKKSPNQFSKQSNNFQIEPFPLTSDESEMKKVKLNQKDIAIQTSLKKQYRHVCIQFSNQQSEFTQTEQEDGMNKEIQTISNQKEESTQTINIINFVDQKIQTIQNSVETSTQINLVNESKQIDFSVQVGTSKQTNNCQTDEIKHFDLEIQTYNQTTQESQTDQIFTQNEKNSAYFKNFSVTQETSSEFNNVDDNMSNRDIFINNKQSISNQSIKMNEEYIENKIALFLRLQEKNQELMKNVQELETKLQKREIQIIQIINDIKHFAPDFNKTKIQEYLIALAETNIKSQTESTKFAISLSLQKSEKRKIIVHYSSESIHLIQFEQKEKEKQSSKFIGSLLSNIKDVIAQIEFEIDEKTEFKQIKGQYDEDLNVHSIIMVDQNGCELKFSDFSVIKKPLIDFSKTLEEKKHFSYIHFLTTERQFFIYKQLLCEIAYSEEHQIYPSDDDLISFNYPSSIEKLHSMRQFNQIEKIKQITFTDQNIAERFQMLDQLFVIRGLVVYYNEQFGFYGIQALYMISKGEWYVSSPHLSLSKRFDWKTPLKNIKDTFEEFKNHDKKILMKITYYQDIETNFIHRFELTYQEIEESFITFGRELSEVEKFEKITIKVSPNSYLTGKFMPLLGIKQIFQNNKDALYPSDYVLTSIELKKIVK